MKLFHIAKAIGFFLLCSWGQLVNAQQKGITDINHPEGIYAATIPCADCGGISQVLEINSNKLFTLEETYLGKSGKVFRTDGVWKVKNGKLYLYDEAATKLIIGLRDGQLYELDRDGNFIEGKEKIRYRLHRMTKAEPGNWQQKKEAGIDIIAMGNEPFWGLDIEEGKQIVFTDPSLDKPVILPYARPLKQEKALVYDIKTEASRLVAEIRYRYCSDGMSDRIYPYAVRIHFNGKEYAGCGVILNMPTETEQLNGEWELEFIDAPGLQFDSLYARVRPSILFNPATHKVGGSTGCNRFNGPYTTDGRRLEFDLNKTALTRMACPGDGERIFLDNLKKVKRFHFYEGKLELLSEDKVVMRWKKKL